ncbi:hypothetical protein BFJ67_g16997 [Fusarium oxysporum f. sp. cepae]|nr:hypothetical protein BFJ67_g16997 [Fusarium oxysporum f. sp. cepae]
MRHNLNPTNKSNFQQFLDDKEFYEARRHVWSNSPDTWRFRAGVIFWEVLGTKPGDYMVFCDMLTNPKGDYEKSLRHLKLTPHLSLEENRNEIQMCGISNLATSTMSRELKLYHEDLKNYKEVDFWSLNPSKSNGVYALEYGLMSYVQNEWAKVKWAYPNEVLTRKFQQHDLTQAQSTGDDSNSNAQYEQPDGKIIDILISSPDTDEAPNTYEQLQDVWKIDFPHDFALTDDNKRIIQKSEGSKISCDWEKIFEDEPQECQNWISGEMTCWQHIIVSRAAVIKLYDYPRKTYKGLDILLEYFYKSLRLFNPTYVKMDKQGRVCIGKCPVVGG